MRAWSLSLILLSLTLAACAPTVNSQRLPSAPRSQMPAGAAMPQQSGVQVALLVPLTGAQASLGQSLLNAAQLAVHDLADDEFTLIPQDTASSAAGAEQAASRAIAAGAEAIVGPVFSAEVQAIYPQARGRVPVLALSNNATLAGRGIYILGSGPEQQLERTLEFAANRGVKRVAALLAYTPYGDAVETALSDLAPQLGLELVHLERYAPSSSPAVAAAALAQTLASKGQIDALILPESGARLDAFATAVRQAGITARLIGTGVWEANRTSSNPALAGSWYAALDTSGRDGFLQRYRSTYGAEPAPIVSLAYDATAMSILLARGGAANLTTSQFEQAAGFTGVDGALRLLPSGRTSRALAIFEFTPAGLRQIEAAPRAAEL